MNIIIVLIALTNARAIIKRRPTVMLYGDYGHLEITKNGHVKTTTERNSPSATIEFINTGNNQFQMRSVSSGLYLAKRRSRGKFVKLRGTYNKNEAMVFSEHVTDNYLNEYTSQIDNKLCKLIQRPNGTVGLRCRGKVRHSTFLPRRVHVKHLYTGQRNWRSQTCIIQLSSTASYSVP